LSQERLDEIFSFENMISEIAVQPYEEIGKAG
jgi:aspartate ammonia-lyase